MADPAYLEETRAAYDVVAADYASLLRGDLATAIWDRAVLAAFAEQVQAAGGGAVADVGCGPGRITAHLDALGLEVFGVDLSPGMVAVARRDHPALRFSEGALAALDLPDGALGGLVAWYSIIHTPPADQPAIYAELARVLRPGGLLLLAFQVGDERVHFEEAYGHAVSYDAYRLSPDQVAAGLAAAGFVVTARVVREAEGRERTPQAYLFARSV